MNIINQQKCGEIYLVKASTYNFVCCCCEKHFADFIFFRNHFEINHCITRQREESIDRILKKEFSFRNSEKGSRAYEQNLSEKHEDAIKMEQVDSIENSWINELVYYTDHDKNKNICIMSDEETSINPTHQQNFNSNLQMMEKGESICNNSKSDENEIENQSEENSFDRFEMESSNTSFTDNKTDNESDKSSISDNDNTTMKKGYSKRAVYCPHCQYEYKIFQNHDKEKCAVIQEIIKNHNNDFEALKKEGIFLCKDCPRYFDKLRKLTFHRRCHYNRGTCSICFKHVKHLDIHTRSLHPGEKYVKAKNVEQIENNRILQCSYCDKTFKMQIHLQKHEVCHQNDSLKCKYCDRHFKRPILLKNHLRTHTGERPYQCSQCPAAFALKRNLSTHIIYKHTEETPYACRYEGGCGKSFKTKDLRNNHERRHTQSIEFQCEICGMNFNEKPKLRMHHKRKHLDYNLRPHHCQFCDKKFVKKNYLREHERTHTGEKPLKCDLCPSSFAKSSSLREHKKLHSDEKKHVCKICGKAFAQSAGYSNHMKNHP